MLVSTAAFEDSVSNKYLIKLFNFYVRNRFITLLLCGIVRPTQTRVATEHENYIHHIVMTRICLCLFKRIIQSRNQPCVVFAQTIPPRNNKMDENSPPAAKMSTELEYSLTNYRFGHLRSAPNKDYMERLSDLAFVYEEIFNKISLNKIRFRGFCALYSSQNVTPENNAATIRPMTENNTPSDHRFRFYYRVCEGTKALERISKLSCPKNVSIGIM